MIIPISFIGILILVAVICWALNTLLPWLNKHIFSKIWSEETRPAVARETIDRIKELCVDGDVSEETAILMAAKENNLTEDELLASFNASDAKELVSILSGKNSNMLSVVMKKLSNLDRVNMRR